MVSVFASLAIASMTKITVKVNLSSVCARLGRFEEGVFFFTEDCTTMQIVRHCHVVRRLTRSNPTYTIKMMSSSYVETKRDWCFCIPGGTVSVQFIQFDVIFFNNNQSLTANLYYIFSGWFQ